MNQGYDQLTDEAAFQGQNEPQVVVHSGDSTPANTTVVPNAVRMNTLHMETTHVSYVHWTWCHLVTAVFSIFCCSIFGIIATISSLMSYVDHKTKDFDR